MVHTTATVEGYLAGGIQSMANAKVLFVLKGIGLDDVDDLTIPANTKFEFTADENGFVVANIWPNARSKAGTYTKYVVKVQPAGTTGWPIELGKGLWVPEGGPFDLEKLLGEFVEPQPFDVSVVTQVQQNVGQAQSAVADAQAHADRAEQQAGDYNEAAVEGRLNDRFDQFVADSARNMPVTPNLLADAKYWSSLCGGQTDVETEIFAAHIDSKFSLFWYNGGSGAGTLEVVTLDNLSARGIPYGQDLAKATANNPPNFAANGSDWRVVLLDVTIQDDGSGAVPALYLLNQGSPKFTGLNVGEFKTQSSGFLNVVEHSGSVSLHWNDNAGPALIAGADDVGAGWVFKHAVRDGFGGSHQPHFKGAGSMKVAIALPYWGYGDHGGNFIFANSLGRYSHGADRLQDGMDF